MKNSNGKLYVCIDERASSKAYFDGFGDGSLTLNKWMQQSRDDDLLEGPQVSDCSFNGYETRNSSSKEGI